MLLQISVIRRIASFFERQDTVYPYVNQPIERYKQQDVFRERIAGIHAQARKDRIGNYKIYAPDRYQNVIRIDEYVGTDATGVHVPGNKMLTANVTLVGPDSEVREISFSFKSGEQFSVQEFDRRVKGLARSEFTGTKEVYEYVRGSIIKADFYLTEFRPKVQV